MEQWETLMEIFLNSPSPEADASIWFTQHQNQGSIPLIFSAFLSLLLKPSLPFSHSSNSCMWIQILPESVQSRILSFLSINSHRFSSQHLYALATNILNQNTHLHFWVRKSALNLLRTVSFSDSVCSSFSDSSLEKEFGALPHWLQKIPTSNPILPWLPTDSDVGFSIRGKGALSVVEKEENMELGTKEADPDVGFSIRGKWMLSVVEKKENVELEIMEAEDLGDAADIQSEQDSALDPETQIKAADLKSRFLGFDSRIEVTMLANEIRQLCFDAGGNSQMVLSLIEPWEADDEIVSLILPQLSVETKEFPWSAHVLSSVVLPKLLVLKHPASRVLSAATIEFCKIHQRAAVDALLFPLVLRKEGMNTPLCDIIVRIAKECLHSAHISAFCQRLLCYAEGEIRAKKIFHLPCHRSLISEKLVWTEALFTLFQNILSLNVYLTEDTIDQIVCVVDKVADSFSKSLKFGNFLLSLVGKCGSQLKFHKLLLVKVAERTETFMSKSIISKLDAL